MKVKHITFFSSFEDIDDIFDSNMERLFHQIWNRTKNKILSKEFYQSIKK